MMGEETGGQTREEVIELKIAVYKGTFNTKDSNIATIATSSTSILLFGSQVTLCSLKINKRLTILFSVSVALHNIQFTHNNQLQQYISGCSWFDSPSVA